MTGWIYQLIYSLTIPLRIVMDTAINNTISASLELNQNLKLFDFSSLNETLTILYE